MQQKDAIIDVMRMFATGSKNAKPREFILSKVNEHLPKEHQLTDRKFRDLYAELSVTHLLGSHHEKGYFIITNREDLMLSLDALDHAAESISVRKNMILHSYQQRYGTVDRQRDLFV